MPKRKNRILEQQRQAKLLDEAYMRWQADPTPENMQKVQDIARETPQAILHSTHAFQAEQAAAAQGRYSPLLKTALSLGGVGASIGQINMANSLRGGLVQPAIPSAPGVDPTLQQQIFNAQRGTMDAGKAAYAANVGINDAYNQAVQEATNTAAGQSGTRQALVNAANLRKMRASASMLPELDAIRAREEGRADELVGRRAGLAQQQYANQLHGSQIALDQYNRNVAAIGQLGMIGHENLFGQLGDLSDNIIPGTMAFANPYRVTKPQHDSYGDVSDNIDGYEHSINASLKNFNNIKRNQTQYLP